MKKIKLVVLMTMLLGATMLNADTYGKQNYFGINPFGLIFNIYSGEYGRFLDAEGTTEINVPFYFYTNDFFGVTYTALGLGAKYRIYKDGNGEGVFYGGGLTFDSWTVEDVATHWDAVNGYTYDDVTWINITPMGELGFRWSWANGWTIAPSLELGFDVSTFDDGDTYSSLETGGGGLHWGLNLGIAYMF